MWNRILIVSGMVSLWAAFALTGCVKKEQIFYTDHPEHGKIVLTADKSQHGQDVDIRGSYHARVDGDQARQQSFTTKVKELAGLYEPGEHRIVVWHDAEGIDVNGNTAAVGTTNVMWDGELTPGRGEFLIPDPGWLFSCAMDVAVKPDKVNLVTAVMTPRVRQLTLIVEPVGETIDRIENITAMISGVAGTIDLDSGAHGTPSCVMLPFTRIDSGPDAGKWSATVRLVGIADGAEAQLTGTISFVGGSPADVALESDLGGALAGFNDGDEAPLVIGGSVVETPAGTGFRATITGWVTVDRPGIEF